MTPRNRPERVAAYVCIWTEDQRADGHHTKQRQRIETYAFRRRMEIDRVYVDDDTDRAIDTAPARERLLAHIDRYDAVLVYEPYLLGHTAAEEQRVRDQLRKADVDLIPVRTTAPRRETVQSTLHSVC